MVYICLITDIPAIINILSLVIQKTRNGWIFNTLFKWSWLSKVGNCDTAIKFKEINALRKIYHVETGIFRNYWFIFQDKKGLHSKRFPKKFEKLHSNVAIPLIQVLIKEFENIFDISDFPALDSSNTL